MDGRRVTFSVAPLSREVAVWWHDTPGDEKTPRRSHFECHGFHAAQRSAAHKHCRSTVLKAKSLVLFTAHDLNLTLCSLDCSHRTKYSSWKVRALCMKLWTLHTHTHTFNGPLSGTTRVSRYQKSKTNLDFIEARDSEWQWHQLGHMQVCISLQTENHASTPPLSFLQAGCPSCPPNQQHQSTEGILTHWHNYMMHNVDILWLLYSMVMQCVENVIGESRPSTETWVGPSARFPATTLVTDKSIVLSVWLSGQWSLDSSPCCSVLVM